MMKSIQILLITLSLIHATGFASVGGPYNYYHLPSPPLLNNVEKLHYQQGVDKVNQHKMEYAWSEFAFILHYFPNHPQALEQISELGIKMKQTDRAIKYFEQALKLYPDEAATYSIFGRFLTKIGKLDEAIHQHKQAISLNSNSPEFHYQLALAYRAQEKFAQFHREENLAFKLGYQQPHLQ